jgi:two-component system alkaline phosphatase synthesis response regulator PhoP
MKNILIVDDEPHVAIILKQFLERSGYHVITVLNGEQALSVIASDLPDLIITDVQMPKMNGIQLCETIKKEIPHYHNLIIMMTSRTDTDIRNWIATFPHIELMEKPLSMRRLAARIKDYFEQITA